MKDVVDFFKEFDLHTIIIVGVVGWMLYGVMSRNFDKIEKRFDKIDSRFEKLEDKVEDVDRRLCRLEGASMSYCYAKKDRLKDQDIKTKE